MDNELTVEQARRRPAVRPARRPARADAGAAGRRPAGGPVGLAAEPQRAGRVRHALRGPHRAARGRRGASRLRAARPRRRQPPLHRPPRPHRRRADPAPHRLARARRPGVLPGDRRAPRRRRAPSARGHPRADRDERRGRGARPRPADRRLRRAARAGCPARARCWPAWPRAAPAGWATSSRRSRASRTRSSAPSWAARSSSRAARAPARRPSRCTARPTCCTRTGGCSSARASCSSARAARSCATSTRCCPRSARRASSRRPSRELYPGIQSRRPRRTRPSPSSRAARCGRSVIARAVRDRERIPAQPVHVRVDGHDLVIRPNDIASAMARARRNHKPHNQARVSFVRDMLGRLAEQYVQQLGQDGARRRARRDHRGAAHHAGDPDRAQPGVDADHAAEAGRPTCGPSRTGSRPPHRSSARSSARCWCARPTRPGRRRTSRSSTRPPSCSARTTRPPGPRRAPPTERRASELAYARQVLESTGSGGMVSAEMLADRFATTGPTLTTAERAAADRSWTYGHVVVDEAQELSAMAWRSLLRRVPDEVADDRRRRRADHRDRRCAQLGGAAGPGAALVVAAQRADRELPDPGGGRRHRPAGGRRGPPARQPADVGPRGGRLAASSSGSPADGFAAAVAATAEKLVAEVTDADGRRADRRDRGRTRGSPRSRDALRDAGLRPALGTGSSAADLDAPLVVLTPARGQGPGVRRRRARRAGRGARRERGRPVRRDDAARPGRCTCSTTARCPAAGSDAPVALRLTRVRGPDRCRPRGP